MKPLPPASTLSVFLGGVRLYRDDLELLLAVLRGHGLEVTLRDDKFEYDTLQDLCEGAGASPRVLGIGAKLPQSYKSLSVDFAEKRWHLHVGDADLLSVACDCESLLRRRQTAIEHLPIYWLGALGFMLLWAALQTIKWPSLSVPLATLGVGLFSCALTFGAYWQLYPRIILRFAHEAGFLRRNRDPLLIAFISALVGALSLPVVRWAAKKFTSSP